jgi:Putative Flp pilus-assembly TadE/G-like
MTHRFDRVRAENGQVIVLVVALFLVLFGIAALVIDGGRWFQTHRHLQTAADAAALAGVQALPSDPAGASSAASTYAQNNFSGATASISIPPGSPLPSVCNSGAPYNCIRVTTSTTVPGTFAKFFARLRGYVFGDRNESARATAAVTVPANMKAVAPIAVKNTVACQVDSCFNTTKTVSFDESNVASSTIGLIDLTCHSTVSTACPWNAGVGASELKGWIESGYPDALPSNQWYGVKTGQNVGPIKQGFTDKLGQPLYFPVFDQTANAGPVWYFHIIGWSLFVIDQVVSWTPSNKTLQGHFIKFTTSDLPAGLPPSSSNDFGVHILSLVE